MKAKQIIGAVIGGSITIFGVYKITQVPKQESPRDRKKRTELAAAALGVGLGIIGISSDMIKFR